MGRIGERRASWRWFGGAALCVVAAFFLGSLAVGPERWLDRGDKLASVGSLLLTAVSLLVGVAALRAGRRTVDLPADPSVLLDRAAEDLARLVGRQWEREAAARLLRPSPLRVRWSSTRRRVAPSAAEVVGGSGMAGRPTRLRLAGDVAGTVTALRQLPARQLVVIGAPGSGKSTLAVLATVELVRNRTPDEPVPVLLTMSSWDPRQQHLDTWLAGRLVEQYPVLGDRGPYGPGAAIRLVDRGRILPILDGLDEMPAGLHSAAVVALSEAVGQGRPLVLTCRSDEYQRAVTATGTPLGRAAVVEIEPVSGTDVAEYLPAGQTEGAHRWAAVLAELRDNPTGALARALNTPLMVYLARTAYASPRTDPSELLGFEDPAAVEARLLDAYLPAIYARRPPPSGAGSAAPAYPPERAERWLSFLARHLDQQRTPDLAWWRLVRAVPGHRALVGAVFGAGLGAAFGSGAALAFGPGPGIVAGLGFTVGFGLTVGLWFADGMPSRLRFRPLGLVASCLAGLALGFLSGLVPGSGTSERTLIGIGLGLGLGLLFGFGVKTTDGELLDPRSTLRQDRTVFLALGLVSGALVVLVGGGLLGFAFEAGFPALAGPRLDLGSSLVLGVVGGLGLGLGVQLMSERVGVFQARPGTGSAWARYVIATCALAVRGQLPWSPMRFLDDAYRRGMLRQVGPVYQFRHARLQEHLGSVRSRP